MSTYQHHNQIATNNDFGGDDGILSFGDEALLAISAPSTTSTSTACRHRSPQSLSTSTRGHHHPSNGRHHRNRNHHNNHNRSRSFHDVQLYPSSSAAAAVPIDNGHTNKNSGNGMPSPFHNCTNTPRATNGHSYSLTSSRHKRELGLSQLMKPIFHRSAVKWPLI